MTRIIIRSQANFGTCGLLDCLAKRPSIAVHAEVKGLALHAAPPFPVSAPGNPPFFFRRCLIHSVDLGITALTKRVRGF